MLKLIWAFLTCLPELVALIKQVLNQVKEAQTRKEVKDGIKVINESFKNKDADTLRKLFSGELRK